MPTVVITHEAVYKETVKISRSFYILEDFLTKKILWDSDGQNPGIINAWLQYADTEPQFVGVLPSWQVEIDGLTLEKKFYEEIVNLKGKKVCLHRDDWEFVFDFTS